MMDGRHSVFSRVGLPWKLGYNAVTKLALVCMLLLLVFRPVYTRTIIRSSDDNSNDDEIGPKTSLSSSLRRRHRFEAKKVKKEGMEWNQTVAKGSSYSSVWNWPWPRYQITISNTNTSSLPSMGIVWKELEETVRDRAKAAEGALWDVQQLVEATAREVHADVTRETERFRRTLLEVHLQADSSARAMESDLWDTKGGQRIQHELEHIHCTLEFASEKVERDVQTQLLAWKRAVKREWFRQREGWTRWSRSIRNHLGVIAGSVTTFLGGLTPVSRRRTLAMQCGQCTWMLTNQLLVGNTTLLVLRFPDSNRATTPQKQSPNVISTNNHPWIQDLSALTVATFIWRGNIPIKPRLDLVLPIVSIGCAVFRSVRRVSDILHENDTFSNLPPSQKRLAMSISAIVGTALLVMVPIPTSVMAASLAGTKLILDSIVDEVVGNWFDMVERIGPERLRVPQRLYNALNRRFHRTFIYPVQEALVELEGAFINGESKLLSFWEWLLQKRLVETQMEQERRKQSIRQRIKQAVSRCFRLRLTWTIASFGVALQMVLLHRGLVSSPISRWVTIVNESLKKHKEKKDHWK